jgi:hypothetical protein
MCFACIICQRGLLACDWSEPEGGEGQLPAVERPTLEGWTSSERILLDIDL